MRILLVAHGYPPELAGGTEHTVQALARGLARRGHDVQVVAGTLDRATGPGPRVETLRSVDRDPEGGSEFPVLRLARSDLYFDHWHKADFPPVSSALLEICREFQPDVVHVHHWIRLSRDLVRVAARCGIPAVLTLHDFHTSCPLTFRLRPDTGEFCEAAAAPDPCLACAGSVPPWTPFVATARGEELLAARRRDFAAEIAAARVVIAPSRSHLRELQRRMPEADVATRGVAIRPAVSMRALAGSLGTPPLPPEGPLLLGAMGELCAAKGTDLLIDALGRLKEPSRVVLRLAGSPGDDGFGERLRRRAASLPVEFLGSYRREELAEHPVRAVHAMVSGTRARESYGLIADEAAALGLPAVLPDLAVFRERVGGARPTAVFFAQGDAEDLARVLQRLVDSPSLLAELRGNLPTEPGREADPLDEHLAAYARATREGAPPEAEAAGRAEAGEWIGVWDAEVSRCTAAELGLRGGA